MGEELNIVCCSGEDSECYMSKGHHHFADFLKAAEEHLGEKPNGFDGPTHEWWRAIPAPRGSDYKFHYHPAKAGERGAFRVTVISRY